MLDINFTFLWTALNLLILYIVVKKFLFGKVSKYMEDRAKGISDDIEQSRKLKAEALEDSTKYKQLLSEFDAKCDEMLEDARKKAKVERIDILNQAKEEAAFIVTSAHKEAEQVQLRAERDMHDRVASLALLAASKVIEANMDNERNRELVNSFLKKEGAA